METLSNWSPVAITQLNTATNAISAVKTTVWEGLRNAAVSYSVIFKNSWDSSESVLHHLRSIVLKIGQGRDLF